MSGEAGTRRWGDRGGWRIWNKRSIIGLILSQTNLGQNRRVMKMARTSVYLNFMGKTEEEMFWGGYFGSCIDKFGVRWMFNCANED